MSDHTTSPTRRRRLPRWAAVSLAVVLALSGTAVAGGFALGAYAEGEAADRLACALPAGAELGDVHLSPHPALDLLGAGDRRLDVVVEVDADAMGAALAARPGPLEGAAPAISIGQGVVRVALPMADLDAAVELAPRVEDGLLRFEAESVRVGSRSFAPRLLANVLPDDVSQDLHDLGRTDLPDGVSMTSAAVVDDHLEVGLTASIDDVPASDPCAQDA